MANASRLGFGDVVLVPFPFTDQSGAKKRPDVVISSYGHNTGRRDIVIMAITSQVRTPLGFGEATVADWQGAGLVKTSVLKPVVATRAGARRARHGAPVDIRHQDAARGRCGRDRVRGARAAVTLVVDAVIEGLRAGDPASDGER